MRKKGKVALYTLGCKLNYAESSIIAADMARKGYDIVDFEETPDIFIINTCSVTDFADRKSRKIIRKAKKINPDSKVIVIGCYAQLKPEEISEINGVNLVLGAGEKFNIDKYLSSMPEEKFISCEINDVEVFHAAHSSGDRTRSFLKIQTGCDYICTYCTIPKARGMSRSGTSEEIIENARGIAKKGIKEIVLTGVNIGDYGKGIDEDIDFLGLLKKLDMVKGIERIRISSIEPNLLTDEIIEFVAESRAIVPHFHIPLQSGSDKILQLMKRRYKRELYAQRVIKVNEIMPHACIGVDVITGFPGETDDDFIDTYNFINSLDISYLHVFTYSERTGTPAVSLPGKIPIEIRRERNAKLTNLSLKKKYSFYSKFSGETRKVLVEKSKEENKYTGFTDNYIKVKFNSNINIENDIIDIKLVEIDSDYLMKGNIVNNT
jgi:threonylcarbamoyladenosine tRNA methylthiotransferase MtaB